MSRAPGSKTAAALGRRAAGDVFFKILAIAIGVAGLVVFALAAYAGTTVVGRLGTAGWLIYVVVMGTFALVFGPVLVSAVTIYQRGSQRARDATQQRRARDAEKYNYNSSALEAGKARAAQRDSERPPPDR